MIWSIILFGCNEKIEVNDSPQIETLPNESSKKPKEEQVKENPLVISLSKSSYSADDMMVITVNNPSNVEQKYTHIIMDRQTKDGEWKLIRGNLLCPCLSECQPGPFVLPANGEQQHQFDYFYEIRGESAPHTVFCGMMRPANLRVRLLNHDDVEPVQFSWN